MKLFFFSILKEYQITKYLSFYQGSKETAFLYAITSAGVVHTIAKSCASGKLCLTLCIYHLTFKMTVQEIWLSVVVTTGARGSQPLRAGSGEAAGQWSFEKST